jgi:hypothetical protein
MDTEAGEVADYIISHHTRAIHVPPGRIAELRAALRAQCVGLYKIYGEGLAATFAKLNALAQKEQDLIQKRATLINTTLPVIRCMYRRHLAPLEHAVASAVRAIDLAIAEVSAAIAALTRSPRVRELQVRAEACMQPVFGDAKVSEQQRLAMSNPDVRRLVVAGSIIRDDEPRIELTEDTGNSAIAAINQCFGVKHLHRRCRVAAPLHAIKDLLWHCVEVELVPGAARALGMRTGRIVALAASPCTVQGVKLRRFTIVGGDCDPSARTPRGETVVHMQQGCVATERTLWRAAEWPIPSQLRFGEPEMLGMGGHAKSVCMRTIKLLAPQTEQYVALILARDMQTLGSVIARFDECKTLALPAMEAGLEPGEALGRAALALCGGEEPDDDACARYVTGDGRLIAALGGTGTAICKVLRVAEGAVEWDADLGELWAPDTKAGRRVARVQLRAPRVGDTKRDMDDGTERALWYRTCDAVRYMVDSAERGWTERAIATWCAILGAAGCTPHSCHSELTAAAPQLRDAVLALADPLRWHVSQVVRTIHEEIDFPPIQCAETAPSCFSKSQQLELVSAAFWFHHAAAPDVRAECARMLRVFHYQIGRYAAVVPCADGPIKTEKRRRSGAQVAWREAKKTCARTLNCDHPDARPALRSEHAAGKP